MSTGVLAFKFCAFGVVTAPPLARRWVLRGGSLVSFYTQLVSAIDVFLAEFFY